MGTVTNCTVGRSDGKGSTVEFVSRSISVFSCLVDDLIKSWENIICKLHFCNWSCSSCCNSDSKSCDTLLREWCVKNSISTVLLIQPHGAPEHSSKLDILAKNDSLVIFLHGQIERVSDGGAQIHNLFVVWILELQLVDVESV